MSQNDFLRTFVLGVATMVCMAVPVAVRAQTACPGGVPPGDARCGPSPGAHGIGGGAPPPRPRMHYWAPRWGAIAFDGAEDAYGAVDGLRTERKARKKALAKCRAMGGKNCDVASYYDQCGALVVGDGRYVRKAGPTDLDAVGAALARCQEVDKNCRLIYAGCSYPELEPL